MSKSKEEWKAEWNKFQGAEINKAVSLLKQYCGSATPDEPKSSSKVYCTQICDAISQCEQSEAIDKELLYQQLANHVGAITKSDDLSRILQVINEETSGEFNYNQYCMDNGVEPKVTS
jgi:hypothetical protein